MVASRDAVCQGLAFLKEYHFRVGKLLNSPFDLKRCIAHLVAADNSLNEFAIPAPNNNCEDHRDDDRPDQRPYGFGQAFVVQFVCSIATRFT